MKFLNFFIIILIISCSKKDEKKPFVVSEFNRNLEKHFEEAKKKNPELNKIREIKLYDYPKGKLNFIFTKDNKIYFYEDRLVFKSHAFNIQRGVTEIKYKDISEVKKRMTMFFVPNGIGITTKNGFCHKFVVYERDIIIEFLNSKIDDCQSK